MLVLKLPLLKPYSVIQLAVGRRETIVHPFRVLLGEEELAFWIFITKVQYKLSRYHLNILFAQFFV